MHREERAFCHFLYLRNVPLEVKSGLGPVGVRGVREWYIWLWESEGSERDTCDCGSQRGQREVHAQGKEKKRGGETVKVNHCSPVLINYRELLPSVCFCQILLLFSWLFSLRLYLVEFFLFAKFLFCAVKLLSPTFWLCIRHTNHTVLLTFARSRKAGAVHLSSGPPVDTHIIRQGRGQQKHCLQSWCPLQWPVIYPASSMCEGCCSSLPALSVLLQLYTHTGLEPVW